MKTFDTPQSPPHKPLNHAASAPRLTLDDPRRGAEAVGRRRSLKLAERDEFGRLLPGSVLPNAGRRPGVMVTTLARRHTDEAIALLAAVMADAKAPQAARVTAAQALLDRGWGKAPIQIDLNVRAKFDDFLRDVGVLADQQRDQGLVQIGHEGDPGGLVVEAGLKEVLEDEIDGLRPITDE